jgi:hypothetical protein
MPCAVPCPPACLHGPPLSPAGAAQGPPQAAGARQHRPGRSGPGRPCCRLPADPGVSSPAASTALRTSAKFPPVHQKLGTAGGQYLQRNMPSNNHRALRKPVWAPCNHESALVNPHVLVMAGCWQHSRTRSPMRITGAATTAQCFQLAAHCQTWPCPCSITVHRRARTLCYPNPRPAAGSPLTIIVTPANQSTQLEAPLTAAHVMCSGAPYGLRSRFRIMQPMPPGTVNFVDLQMPPSAYMTATCVGSCPWKHRRFLLWHDPAL